MLKYSQLVGEPRIAALRGCILYKISPLKVGNFGSFSGLYLSLRSSQALQISLLLLCGRVLQLRSVAAIHFMVCTPIPRTERYCPLSCIFLTSWNSALGQSHCSRARRHGATSVGRLPAVGPATALETAVWAAWPTVSWRGIPMPPLSAYARVGFPARAHQRLQKLGSHAATGDCA